MCNLSGSSVGIGVGPVFGQKPKTLTFSATITVDTEPSAAALGDIVAGQTHLDLLTRVSEGVASTDGAGAVTITGLLIGPSDPVQTGETATFRFSYSAADARTVTREIGPFPVVAPAITLTEEPSLVDVGDVITGEAFGAILDRADAGTAVANNGAPVSIVPEVLGGNDPAELGDNLTIRYTYLTPGAATVVRTLGPLTVIAPPVVAPTVGNNLNDLSLVQNTAMASVDLSVDFTGSGITYALAPTSDALPAGVTLSSAGILSGTPTETVTARNIIVRGTNTEDFADSAFSLDVLASTGRPDPFVAGDWSVADAGTGGDAIVTINSLPDGNGLPVQVVQYAIDSPNFLNFAPMPGSDVAGDYTLTDVFTDGVATDIRLRAVNANGAFTTAEQATSDTKTVTTSAPAVPVAAGNLGNITVAQDTGDVSVPTRDDFTVAGDPDLLTVTFALTTSTVGVSIDDNSGIVEVDTTTADIQVGTTITVEADNGAGTATSSFLLTVEAASVLDLNIASISQSAANANVDILYALTGSTSEVFDVVLFLNSESTPVAGDFNGGTAAYIDIGQVTLTDDGTGITLACPAGLDDSYQLGFLSAAGDIFVSPSFALDSVVPAPATAAYEGHAATAGGSLAHTFNSATTGSTLPATFTAGKKVISVYNDATDGVGLASVVVDGVTATQRGAGEGEVTHWEATITGDDTNSIVVTGNSGGFNDKVMVAMHDVTGKNFQAAQQLAGAGAANEDLDFDVNTAAGDVVIVANGIDNTTRTYTPNNTTTRVENLTAAGRAFSVFSNLDATGGTPETFGFQISLSTNADVEAVHYA